MSMIMDENIWGDALFAKIALERMGDVPEDFRIYGAGWLGEFPNMHGMEVKGAEFKRLKRDPSRGNKVSGTTRTVYISKKDLQDAK